MNLIDKISALFASSPAPQAAPPPPSGTDRRGAQRYAVGCPAALFLHDRRLSVKLQDLSSTGLQLVTRFETDPEFDLELEVGDQRFTLTARVTRVDFEHGLYRLGAQFVRVTAEQAALLDTFIDVQTRHHDRTVA